MKTVKVVLHDVKDPDAWDKVIQGLGLNENDSGEYRSHIRWGEVASVELTIDEDLNIVGGRILPL